MFILIALVVQMKVCILSDWEVNISKKKKLAIAAPDLLKF